MAARAQTSLVISRKTMDGPLDGFDVVLPLSKEHTAAEQIGRQMKASVLQRASHAGRRKDDMDKEELGQRALETLLDLRVSLKDSEVEDGVVNCLEAACMLDENAAAERQLCDEILALESVKRTFECRHHVEQRRVALPGLAFPPPSLDSFSVASPLVRMAPRKIRDLEQPGPPSQTRREMRSPVRSGRFGRQSMHTSALRHSSSRSPTRSPVRSPRARSPFRSAISKPVIARIKV